MHDTEPSVQTPEAPSTAAAAPHDSHRRLVPGWLAALVLVVLVALAIAGGYALTTSARRFFTEPPAPATLAEWRAKVAENPQDAVARLRLAQALEAAGEPTVALAQYERVLRDDPKDIAALYGRGMVLLELGQSSEAVASLWLVLAQDEGHVRAAEALGDYYASKSQYRSLVRAVRPAVVMHPSEARLQYLMGLAYENLGRRDWAIARYRLALDAMPDMPESITGLRRLGETP